MADWDVLTTVSESAWQPVGSKNFRTPRTVPDTISPPPTGSGAPPVPAAGRASGDAATAPSMEFTSPPAATGGAPVQPSGPNGTFATPEERRNFTLDYARQRGVDPALIERLVGSEGGWKNYDITPDSGSLSFGPFQDWIGGGLGNVFQGRGIEVDPRKPGFDEQKVLRANVDYIAEHGASPDVWHGLRRGGGSGGDWSVVGAKGWSVSPSAISDEQGKPDTRVVWMGPDEYKQMVQPSAEPEERAPSKSLQKSLDKGEDIKSLPEMTVKLEDGQYVVKDQDGWRRADAAQKAGVQLIPVAIRGVTGEAKNIVSMNGKPIPFDFKPVAPVTHADEARELREKYGIVGGALTAIGRDIGDLVGGAIRSFGEGAAEGGRDIAGVGPSQPGQNVSPEVVGAEAAFAGAPVAKRIPLPQEVPIESMEMVGARPAPTAGGFTPIAPASPNALANLNAARAAVSERVEQGMVPSAEIERRMDEAQKMGQPLTLPDIGGKPVSDLLGSVYRQGGEAAQKIRTFLEQRDKTAGPRALDALSRYIGAGTGALSKVREALANVRSQNAKPLWDKALEGGSIAPLEQQFEKTIAAADRDIAKAEKALRDADRTIASRNLGDDKGGEWGGKWSAKHRQFAEDNARNAAVALQKAIKVRDETAVKLQKAQADGTANAPGAIWSPRIQQFLEEPKVQQGIRHGQELERLDALAENRPLNLTEYAVVGTKPDGEWIVGQAPTFRLLKVAKQGLDAMVEANTDSLTGRVTETGRSYAKVRDALRNELDRLNPAYKPAREAWEGDTASIRAVNFGRDMLNAGKDHYTADITQHIAEMTPNEKEFAKVGLAATLREKLLRTATSGDESKALVNSEATKLRIRPLFTSEQAADEFLNFVDNERAMFDTKTGTMGGSQTAERVAADASLLRRGLALGRAGLHVAHGNIPAAANSLLNMALSAAEKQPAFSPEVRNAIADLLTDPTVGVFSGNRRGVLPPLSGARGPNALQTLMMRLPEASKALGITPPTRLGAPGGLPVRLPPPQPPMQYRIPPQGPNP